MTLKNSTNFFSSVLSKGGIRILCVWQPGSEAGFFISVLFPISIGSGRAQKVLWVNVTDSCMYQRRADKLVQIVYGSSTLNRTVFTEFVMTQFRCNMNQSNMDCRQLPASYWMNTCKNQMTYVIILTKSVSEFSSYILQYITCPRSSYPAILCSNLLYRMGNCFLDIQ